MSTVVKIAPVERQAPNRKRVAAYARISVVNDAMLHSLSAQVSYYSQYIQGKQGWEFAGVYIDKYTGTKDERPDFQRLLGDCRAGKIDAIVTKSISRFARNTVIFLEIIRELKALNIDVYFERENIHSLSGDGELMLTILASYAQEESKSVSDNCKWRIRKRFAKGELVSLRFLYGYRISHGKVEVDPIQAAVVREIYDDYLSGMGGGQIAKKLRENNVPSLLGGTWRGDGVISILKNEKYTGNALLQKKHIADHLTKKCTRNRGELPQYYAEGTHPAIIDTETFQKAQEIMEQRRGVFKTHDVSRNRYPFSSMIVCEKCGAHFKRGIALGRPFWNCSNYLANGTVGCSAKRIPEATLFAVTAEILGFQEIDPASLAKHVAKIRVPGNNRLVFVLKDGSEIEKSWQDYSRANSWTPEMRQNASDRQREFAKKRRDGE